MKLALKALCLCASFATHSVCYASRPRQASRLLIFGPADLFKTRTKMRERLITALSYPTFVR